MAISTSSNFVNFKATRKRLPGTNNIRQYYTVRRGDTLWEIAYKHKTTWQHLARINNLWNPDLIFPGQVIYISNNGSAAVDLVLTTSIEVYDFKKNRTRVKWTLYLQRRSGERPDTRTSSHAKVVINGTTVLDKKDIKYDFRRNDKVAIANGTAVVGGHVGWFPVSASFTDRSNLIGSTSFTVGLETTLGSSFRGPRVKVGDEYVQTIAYVNVNGKWTQVIPYVKSGGKWYNAGG